MIGDGGCDWHGRNKNEEWEWQDLLIVWIWEWKKMSSQNYFFIPGFGNGINVHVICRGGEHRR